MPSRLFDQSPLELMARLVCVPEGSVKLCLRASAECPHRRAVLRISDESDDRFRWIPISHFGAIRSP